MQDHFHSKKLPSAHEIIKGIVGALVVGFLLYSDRVLSWYQALPWQVTWSGAGVSGVIAAITIYCVRRWPSKIQPHREVIQESLGDIRFAIFAFVFVGVGDDFYQLDVFLSRFYLNWATWGCIRVPSASNGDYSRTTIRAVELGRQTGSLRVQDRSKVD